jgi:hypothetical protein
MQNDNYDLPGFTFSSQAFPDLFAHGLIFRSESSGFRTSLKYDQSNIKDEFISNYREQIKTLVFNKISFPDEVFRSATDFEAYIKTTFPTLSPDEIVNLILDFLYSKLNFTGQIIELKKDDIEKSQSWRKFYLKNAAEFQFYIEYLRDENLIKYLNTKDGFSALTLTIDGISRISQLHSREKSNYCFVAMSFDKTILDTAFEKAIKPALIDTGFKPIILTEQHVDSEKTINDAIISGLKKAHFTIADFSQHRNGVYFEAGYALGRGQKVIYTCSEKDMDKAHFDTRNFQHIVWVDPDDLYTKLVNKIEAFIKD